MIAAARTFPVFFLSLAALSWGIATALSKIAVEQLTSLDLFAVEISTGALCLGVVAFLRGSRPRLPSREVFALGVLEPGLAFLLFDIGITHTAATHGALLLSTDTLFTIGLAWALLDERIDRRIVVALAAGLVGTVLVSLSGDSGMSSLGGDLLVVASSLSAAGYAVLAKRASPRHDPLALTAGQMFVAAAFALPLAAAAALAHHSHLGDAAPGHLAIAVAVGLLASVIPFVLYNAAIDRVTVSISGLVLTLVPLFGALASVVVVGETLAAWQVVGGAFVVLAAGVAATAA